MRWLGAALLVPALAASAGAGEILFTNGSRLEGELANEVLIVSTSSGLVEVAPEQVVLLTRDEIRLRDGRVIRGALVGGHVKARTALGELAIKPDELRGFRVAVSAAPVSSPSPAPSPMGASPAPQGLEPAPRLRGPTGNDAGLPFLAAYQGPAPSPVTAPLGSGGTAPAASAAPSTAVASTGSGGDVSPPTAEGRRLEVVAGESALYRDAFEKAARVGRVVRGQLVTYLDFIDRRLRILNALIFDGGHWVKVRVADGTEGWLPADRVREAR